MQPQDVSPIRRVLQIVAGIFFCFTIAGLVFGFAALKPILRDSGVYAHLCNDGERYCKAQDTRLNVLFIVATSVNNVAALPMGSFLDRVGPRVSSIVGGVLFGAGCVIFSLGIVNAYIDTYLIGYALLAVGAPAMFLAQFHLSNAFPARSGLILSALTGAFDASSLPLCFFKIAYFSLGGKPTVKAFFLGYTIIPILLILQQTFFAPSTAYSRPLPQSTTILDEDGDPLRPSPHPVQTDAEENFASSFSRVSYNVYAGADDDEVKELLQKGNGDGIVGAMFGEGVVGQVKSSWFWAMEFMILVHMTRINWYLATVNTQLIYYTGQENLAETLTTAFIFLLPLGGLASIPFVGYLLDSRPTLDVTLLLSLIGFLFGVLTLSSAMIPQLIGIGMLVVFRPLFYTAVSDYAAKVFGFKTFGTVYGASSMIALANEPGLAMTLSGLFGLILTPLGELSTFLLTSPAFPSSLRVDILVKGPLNGSYTLVNVILLILGVISSLTLAGKVWRYTRHGQVGLEESEEHE
ncbi:hypothetical protein P7C73_g923, partial [Tremellales sp. Uapishka_1]